MTKGFEHVVDFILEDNDEGAADFILTEGLETEIVQNLGGEVTPLNYLLKFEEYLDDHSTYLFTGWEDAEVVKPIKIEKYWCTFYLKVGPKTDFRGALRIRNDKEGQNSVGRKQIDGGWLVKFRILRRYLDQIETYNKERADQLSDQELGKTE